MDLFEKIREKVGCDRISDLPYNRHQVWAALKEMEEEDYSEKQMVDLSMYVFGVKYSFLKKAMRIGKKKKVEKDKQNPIIEEKL